MRTVVALLPGLLCAGGMVFCLRMMTRGGKAAGTAGSGSEQRRPGHGGSGPDRELARLEEEVNRLRAELHLHNDTGNKPA